MAGLGGSVPPTGLGDITDCGTLSAYPNVRGLGGSCSTEDKGLKGGSLFLQAHLFFDTSVLPSIQMFFKFIYGSFSSVKQPVGSTQ